MAWYSRITGAVSRAVNRIFGGPPPAPPPQPVTQATYEQPYIPVEQPGTIPSAAVPGTPEETMGLPAEAPQAPPVYEPTPAPVTDWTSYEADEVTIYDPETYDPVPVDRYMTADDWYREALMPADYLRGRYGPNINNIEILNQLDAEGYYVDWDQWREDYEAMTTG